MEDDQQTTLQTVADVLKYGISAYTDSQQPVYVISDPTYNTEQGLAGRGQFRGITQALSNPLVLIAIVVGVVFLTRR